MVVKTLMPALRKFVASGRGKRSTITPSNVLSGKKSTTIFALVLPDNRWICDSCTLALTSMGPFKSITLKIFCPWRTVAPSSICGGRPGKRLGSLAKMILPSMGAFSVQTRICRSSLRALLCSRSQTAFLASSSARFRSASARSSLVVLGMVISLSTASFAFRLIERHRLA